MARVFLQHNKTRGLNYLSYMDYYNRLSLIAKSVFKWNNLPNNIDEAWIERYLFEEGKCVFFSDKTKGLMVAKVSDSGRVNAYDEATRIRPIATNYKYKALQNYDECIVIKNNDDTIPTINTIQLYAMRLNEISRTIDVNVAAQKTPKIILCSEKQKFSLTKVVEKAEDNELTIYGNNNLDIDAIKTLDTNAPIVFDKLQLQKHAVWNEAMTFLGVNNANQDKKERLVTDEVQANNEQVSISAQTMLKSREFACEQINKLFGLDISVELRKDQTTKREGVSNAS